MVNKWREAGFGLSLSCLPVLLASLKMGKAKAEKSYQPSLGTCSCGLEYLVAEDHYLERVFKAFGRSGSKTKLRRR